MSRAPSTVSSCAVAPSGGDERFEVSDIEVVRPGPSYTVDTLHELKRIAPDNELFLIVGGDVAAGLPAWHEGERVLSLARLAVAKRRGTSRGAVDSALAGMRGGERAEFFRMPRIGISSTMIRRRVRCRAADHLPRPRSGGELHRRTPSLRRTGTLMTPEDIAQAITEYASDHKALDIVQLDLREIISYTDYFVICTGRTDRQVKAIHDAIHIGMKDEHALLPRRVEGLPQASWILMDYLDVIVHVFTPQTREYYRLEQLWGEAPALALAGSPHT